MSRYKVQYLPGGIQRDVGLAVRMRREEPAGAPGACECTPAIEGVFWYNSSDSTPHWDDAAWLGGWDPSLPVRVLGELCDCVVEWTVEVDAGATIYTWVSGGTWSPAPPWGSGLPPIEFGDGIVIGTELSNWLVYNAATVTITATVCGESQTPITFTSGGA